MFRQRLQEQPLELASYGLDCRLPIQLERIASGFPNTLPPQDLKGLELGRVGVCAWITAEQRLEK